MLQDRFKNTDWNMFTHTDLDQYASSVLDHISTTIDSVTTQKQITMYPNQKPWMNRDVRLLLKARNTAFRSGDAQAYSTARAELKRGIKKAKHRYKGKVEKHFTNSNPRRMWQGLQIITDYKTTSPSPTSSDVSFLNELNNFYARFERGNTATATKAAVTPDHQPLTLSPDDVGAVLGRIVVHKAAGPDGIPGRVLRACSGELAEVLTDIFNLVLGSCCGTDLLQIHLHHTGTQELQTIKPQRLPPGSPHPHHHKVLRAAGPSTP
ncbi:hypothetical protein L3Q82_001852 [Scortum barcoo]|uniref:Uncharacterized protein n=1 Tax=Scortum barcoo TaxID=214431 RepID=A0ACB8W513_9TELE|nr:hypothetical protein L3Q82_001852 [Scortum barcoo]